MKIAVIYEDRFVFVQYTPEEFVQYLEQYLSEGYTVREAMDKIIQALKRKTLTA